jgi:predicted  nucleic acid-binding Zn-ribbon protein
MTDAAKAIDGLCIRISELNIELEVMQNQKGMCWADAINLEIKLKDAQKYIEELKTKLTETEIRLNGLW